MKLCKDVVNLIISAVLISLGAGILIGKIMGFMVYIFAAAAIAAGVYLILR